uniref:Uncharacterized protein n=1 Tax=Brassica campestris TaxID=3711 RepID=A0A3P5ZTS4_BRACM|nr:unnamed protein product [Brassica rapa]
MKITVRRAKSLPSLSCLSELRLRLLKPPRRETLRQVQCHLSLLLPLFLRLLLHRRLCHLNHPPLFLPPLRR